MSWMTETRIAVRLHLTRLLHAVTEELWPGTRSMFIVDVAFITAMVSHPTGTVH